LKTESISTAIGSHLEVKIVNFDGFLTEISTKEDIELTVFLLTIDANSASDKTRLKLSLVLAFGQCLTSEMNSACFSDHLSAKIIFLACF